MTSYGVLRNPAAQHGPIRVSASGFPATAARSPLLSPRCRSPAPAHNRTLTTSGAHSTDTVQLTSSSSARRITHPSPDSTSNSSHRRSSGFDDIYDSAVPMSMVLGWERVEEDLGLDEAPMSDPQEWEEMVSLLSFDGEEHKKVTRQLHGANARVEDMFASFDGDDFEAVLRAARNELPHEPNPTDSAQQPPAHANSSSSSSSASSSLYQSVCALRAAAMAAEAAKKQKGPAVKKRRAHLGEPNPADAWMLQVPYAVAGQPAQHGAVAAAAAAAAAAGAAAAVADSSANISTAQECVQQQGREGSDVQQLQLQHLAYIGMSCDSSSDGSCSSSHDDLLLGSSAATVAAAAAAGAGAAAEPQSAEAQSKARQKGMIASNNIVSSRKLGSQLAPASAVLAIAATKASQGRGAAAASAVLEATPVAAPAAVSAALLQLTSRPALLATTDQAQSLAAAEQQDMVVAGGRGAAHVADGVQQHHRWSGRSTQSLRRALARLHHTLPE